MSIATAEEIASKDFTLEEKLSFHLALNFHTPLNPVILPVLMETIWLHDNGRDMSAEMALPEGVDYNGFSTAPASVIFDRFQLKYFAGKNDA